MNINLHRSASPAILFSIVLRRCHHSQEALLWNWHYLCFSMFLNLYVILVPLFHCAVVSWQFVHKDELSATPHAVTLDRFTVKRTKMHYCLCMRTVTLDYIGEMFIQWSPIKNDQSNVFATKGDHSVCARCSLHLICHSTVRLKHLNIDVRARNSCFLEIHLRARMNIITCIEESAAVWGKKTILWSTWI